MDLRRLTLHQLRVFRAVATRRSFTRAAEELHLTQSAVSAQMRALTDVLGVPLLEQFGKRLYLTEAGRSLLEQAIRLEALLGELEREFASYREDGAGSIRVGASTSIGTYFLPSLIAAFSSRHPRIEVALEIENSAQIQERLLRDDFDVAFVGASPISAELDAERFLEDEIFFACAPGHPLTERTALRVEELASFKLLVREPGSATRRAVEEHCRERGFPLPRPAQLGSVEAIKQAVMAGLGVSYFSGLTIRSELETGRLVRLEVESLPARRTFFLLRHRQKRETAALRAMLEFARGSARQFPTSGA
ncbi:MAG: LysR family transcriptional regulator [Deltaproteobacteria bacterium]|nr:LysR family transcriptional regulator [Deltaproteobacteria bacterium]